MTFVLATMVAAISGCSHIPSSESRDTREGDIVLIATTDFHASIDRAEEFAGAIRHLQKKYAGRTLTTSAGDLFQGSIEGNSSKGKAVIDLFNAIPFDVVCMGNHDIDYGPSRLETIVPRKNEDPRGALRARIRESHFVWSSSNVVYEDQQLASTTPFQNALNQKTVLAPHFIKTIQTPSGIAKVCVIGATTPSTPSISFPAFVSGLKFHALKEVVLAEADDLRKNQKCDAVVLLAHAGLLCKSPNDCHEPGAAAEIVPLLESLPQGTLDAVVAGHTHKVANVTINGTPVIEAGAFGKNVGAIHFAYEPASRNVRFLKFEMFETSDKSLAESTKDITHVLSNYRAKADEKRSKKMGKVTRPFPYDYSHESALANAVADALRGAAPHINAAIMNAGGVRQELKGPDITYGDVFKVLPFDNHLVTIRRIKGHLLKTLIEIGVSGSHGGTGFSGLHIQANSIPPEVSGPWDRDLNGDGKKEMWERNLLISVEVYDPDTGSYKPLLESKQYDIATIDFLALGGDHQKFVYDQIEKSQMKDYYTEYTRDVFGLFLSRHKLGLNPMDFLSETNRRVKWIPFSTESKNE